MCIDRVLNEKLLQEIENIKLLKQAKVLIQEEKLSLKEKQILLR